MRQFTSIAIIGPPACGKGTISKWLARDFRAHHLSTGDLLRKHAPKFEGILASDSIVMNLLSKKMSEGEKNFCVLDGFPRRFSQAVEFEKRFPNFLEAVLMIDIPESILLERVQDRWIHLPSGRTYSYSFSPPLRHGVDDVTGDTLVQRNDDTIDSFKQRMLSYHEHLKDIRHFYSQKKLIYEFAGKDSSSIYAEIVKQANQRLPAIKKAT